MTDQRALEGRTMLVTGASSGIGRAIAVAAARAGADVAFTYRKNYEGAKQTAASIEALGRKTRMAKVDLAEADVHTFRDLAKALEDGLAPIDVWVNNAGADILTGDGGALSDVEKLDLLLRVDLRGTMLASWEAARMLGAQPAGGVIINMSWDHVLSGMEGRNPEMYGAVKGGILAFSKCLARSVAPRVRVNVLAPGWIETAFGANLDDDRHRAVAASTPLGRWGTPEDVAAAAVFLASPAASFMTGQTMLVGGGIVM